MERCVLVTTTLHSSPIIYIDLIPQPISHLEILMWNKYLVIFLSVCIREWFETFP
jgi:hypothetical protein